MIVLDKDRIRRELVRHTDNFGYVDMGITDLMILIEKCEVDVEKVVRCRDCVHRDHSVCAEVRKTVKGSDYCAWGRKKKE